MTYNGPTAAYMIYQAMFKIPFAPPPTFATPSAFSKKFVDLITQMLIKEASGRPTAQQLVDNHPFLKE